MDGFFVSSDKDRNKIIYFVGLDQYLDFLDISINSEVISQQVRYDDKVQDYVFVNKRIKKGMINRSRKSRTLNFKSEKYLLY